MFHVTSQDFHTRRKFLKKLDAKLMSSFLICC